MGARRGAQERGTPPSLFRTTFGVPRQASPPRVSLGWAELSCYQVNVTSTVTRSDMMSAFRFVRENS